MQQELPAPGAASREKISPTRLHSPMQRRYATEAAHGARGEQGKKNLPYSIAHGCGAEECSKSCPHQARQTGEEESSLLDCEVDYEESNAGDGAAE